MKNLKNLFRLRVNELRFELKNLEIHRKINGEAMENFSESFKKYIKSLTNAEKRRRLEEISGMRKPKNNNVSKAGEKAKQRGQYKAGKTKIEEEKEAQEHANETREAELKKMKDPRYTKFKALFRDIAKKTHPDILRQDEEKEEKVEIFRKAKEAVEEQKYENLIDYALLLDLEIPDAFSVDYCTPKLLGRRVEETREKVEQITKSVAWGWYHLEGDEMREKLIDNYATYLLKTMK